MPTFSSLKLNSILMLLWDSAGGNFLWIDWSEDTNSLGQGKSRGLS